MTNGFVSVDGRARDSCRGIGLDSCRGRRELTLRILTSQGVGVQLCDEVEICRDLPKDSAKESFVC